jgi:hypothetical protein
VKHWHKSLFSCIFEIVPLMYFTSYEMKSLSSSSIISFCKVRTNICATENSYLSLCLNIATLQRVECVEANLREL